MSAALLAIAVVAVAPARAQREEQRTQPSEDARALELRADRAEASADLDEAIGWLRAMFELEPSAVTLLRIADIERGRGHAALASEYYALTLDTRLPLSEAERTRVERALAETRADTGTIGVRGRVEVGGRLRNLRELEHVVLVDGLPPTSRFDAGEHVVRVETRGFMPSEQRVTVLPGQDVVVELEPLVASADVVASPEPLSPRWMLEDLLALEVDVDVQARRPMWLFGRRIDRGGALAGAVRRLCRAPCSVRLPAGRYAFGVADEAEGTPQHILWDSRLREASVIRIDERSHRDARDVVTVLEIILAPLGLAAVLWGSLTWDPYLQPPLIGAGALTLIGGAAALSVFVLEDQVAIGVVGGSGPPR